MLALLCATTCLTVGMIAWLVFGRRLDPVRQRFDRFATAGAPNNDLRGHAPTKMPRGWDIFLIQAGVEWTPMQTLFVGAIYAAVGYLIGGLAELALPGAVAGVIALFIRLRTAQSRRLAKMAEQLPNALMLMASALKSGLGFQQALQFVAKEGTEPLAPEFGRFANDLAMGSTMDEALVRLQARLGSVDGEMLACALLIQRQTGGNMSEILLNLHHTIRDRQQVQGQVRTLTAQGRMSGFILTGLPVAIAGALYVLNRDYLMMLAIDPRGRMMGLAAIVGMVVGGLMIRKIVTITL